MTRNGTELGLSAVVVVSVTLGRVMSYVWFRKAEAVLSLPATSVQPPAGTITVTSPSSLGATSTWNRLPERHPIDPSSVMQ